MRKALLILLLALAAFPARAQSVHFYGGTIRHAETNDGSYTWGVEYLQDLGEHAAFSVSWLNEGHLPDHHRDGQCLQLWARTATFKRRLSLAAGIGPYFYYDTTKGTAGRSRNSRGLATAFSIAATWYMENRWLIQLRSNFIEIRSSFDTESLAFGVGYQLDPPPSPGPLRKPSFQIARATDKEITLLAGRTIVNNFGTPSAAALVLEYRRGLRRHVDWTIGWLSEGADHRAYRAGPLTQLWAARAFFADALVLGAGAGVHFDLTRKDPYPGEEKITTLAGVTSFTAAYRFHENWLVRTTWNRVITEYHRDSDVIVGGLGYVF